MLDRSERQWKVWVNHHGLTGAIRTHLSKAHNAEWLALVRKHKLKGWDKAPDPDLDTEEAQLLRIAAEPFSKERFEELLTQWITSDDQVRARSGSPHLINAACSQQVICSL